MLSPHADLVAVVQARRAGQAEQHRGEQFLGVAIIVQQGRKPTPDPDVRLHPRIPGVLVPHVVAVFVTHHFQGELVVVAQEDPPLRRRRDRRRLGQDLRDGEAGFTSGRHEDARHQGKVETHVALVAADGRVPVVVDDVRRPLIGLGQQDAARVLVLHHLAAALEEGVGLGQVLTVRAFPDVEIRDGVEAESVDPEVQPESHDVDHGVADVGAVEVQIRLMREESVPEILFPDGIEGPVAGFGIHEDDPGVRISGVVVGPDVVVAVGPLGVLA